jgi:hypothetical protein
MGKTQPHRHARFALLPLSVIAAVFVLPSFDECGKPESMAHFAADGVLMAFWLVPVFFVAALLVVLTVHALAARQVSLAARRVALMGLAVLALSSVVLDVILFSDAQWSKLLWVLPSMLTAVLAMRVIRRGRGKTPWEIWSHLLGAYALLAAGASPGVGFTEKLVAHAGESLEYGAYLYLFAVPVLGLIAARSLRSASARGAL